MKKVLITGIGGDLGQSISRVISECFPDFYIYGTDITNLNSGYLFCNKLFMISSAIQDSYIDDLSKLIADLNIDLLVPSTEKEISLISNFLINDKFFGVRVLGIFQEILSIGEDKYITNQWLNKIGIEVPKTWLFNELNENRINNYLSDFGNLILKKRIGSGSRNIYKLENYSDIPSYVFKSSDEWIVQEFLSEENGEYTIAVSLLDNDFKYIQLKRSLRFASTHFAEVVDLIEVKKIVEKIKNYLNKDCAFNIQLRLKNGLPMIFEINPRFSSTVYSRHILGFPDLANWVAYLMKLNKKFSFNFKNGTKFSRYFSYKVIN
tara:strand:- start:89 stop:1051 length:963 start_codon:yes stop_codon:yes gene_type:complete